MKSDNTQELLEKAEFMLSNDQLLEAISLLEEVDANSVEFEITLLKARVVELRKNRIIGVISTDSWSLEVNKLRLAILELISLVRKLKANNPGRKKDLVLASEIVNIIDTTFNTWQAQTKLKERLIELLSERFEVTGYNTPYDLFSDYFAQMNERELRLHATIRGYTENVIYPNNLKAIKILRENPSLKKLHPDIHYLEQHLALWKSKYDSIFNSDKSICLIFVGLEEGMKFPPNLLAELKEIIRAEDEL